MSEATGITERVNVENQQSNAAFMQVLPCRCNELLDTASRYSGMAMSWVCEQHGAMSVDTRRLPPAV